MATETKKTAAAKAPAKKVASKKTTTKVAKEVKEKEVTSTDVKVKATKKAAPAKEINRLAAKYKNEVVPALVKEFGYSTIMQAPKFEKIVINVGVGDATQNAKALDDALSELATISGQHPVSTRAKKSIATFKLRKGQAIGCKVTLRGQRMYEFFDKLVSISLPRVRDFRGVSKNAFDGHGNYTLGVREQLIFPEIDYDKVSKIRGMDIVIVTTAHSDKEAYELLNLMGMPFRK